MTWNKAHALSAVFALALAALLAGQAHAACAIGHRISHQSADCLRVKIKTAASGQTVKVQNLCPDLGYVVARIDRAPQVNVVLYLFNGSAVKQPATHVYGVYCCKFMGDLCNVSDIVHDDSCLDKFEASSAADSCKDETITATSNGECAISATCRDMLGSYSQDQSTATVSWLDAASLHNCDKELRVGEC